MAKKKSESSGTGNESPSRILSRKTTASLLRANTPLLWPFTIFGSSATTDQNEEPTRPLTIKDYIHKEKVVVNTNNISEIPDQLGLIRSVKILRLTRNIYKLGGGISSLPDSLSLLTKLEILDLRGNPIRSLPNAIQRLSNLCELHLENCKIEEIPDSFKSLTSLKRLNLDNNNIKDPKVSYLTSVEHLSLSNNGIQVISENLPVCLRSLVLSENALNILPSSIFANLSQLEKLYLQGNYLPYLPRSLTRLSGLKVLDVSKNELKSLPQDIGVLEKLVFLNISYNRLTALPEEITKLNLRKECFLFGENPLQKPPMEVVLKGLKSVENYFKVLGPSPSGECKTKRLKVMILGDADAGKSSVAKAIVHCTEPEPENCCSTIGIDFHLWRAIPTCSDQLEILIVDCASQKRYLLTHQLFLSIGMIFTVVVKLSIYECSSTSFKEKIGYWIDLIISKTPNAVILIVPTHLDKAKDEEEVKEKCNHMIESAKDYIKHLKKNCEGSKEKLEDDPTLPSFTLIDLGSGMNNNEACEKHGDKEKKQINLIPVSTKNPLPGLSLLRNEIIQIANSQILSPNVHRTVPQSWVNLEKLCKEEQKRRDYPIISLDELKKAAACFNTRNDIHEALEYVDSVGPIIYLHEQKTDVVFLDPNWLLKLLKMIFRRDAEALLYNDEFASKYNMFEKEFDQAKDFLTKTALLSKKLLRCIWDKTIPNDAVFNQVIAQFQSCNLAFDVELSSLGNVEKQQLLVPWFFKDDCPIHLEDPPLKEKDRIVVLIETRGVIPDGFFERFIIKIYTLNLFSDCIPWKCGFKGRSRDGEILCQYETDFVRRSSFVTLQGYDKCENNVYHLWSKLIPILQEFENLINDWKGLVHGVFTSCPSCFVAKRDKPAIWKLDLSKFFVEDNDLSCHWEMKEIDKWVIQPPHGILRQFLSEPESEKPLKNLKDKLSIDEMTKISTMLAHQVEGLRRVLAVDEGMLHPISSHTDLRERVIKIISFWEEKRLDCSKRVFLKRIEIMRPYPAAVVELLLYGTSTYG